MILFSLSKNWEPRTTKIYLNISFNEWYYFHLQHLRENHEQFKTSLSAAQADFNQLAALDKEIKSFNVGPNPYTWFTMEALQDTWNNLQKIIEVGTANRSSNSGQQKCTFKPYPAVTILVCLISRLLQYFKYFKVIQSWWKCSTSVKQLGFGWDTELLGISSESKLLADGIKVVICRIRVNSIISWNVCLQKSLSITGLCQLFNAFYPLPVLLFTCNVIFNNQVSVT